MNIKTGDSIKDMDLESVLAFNKRRILNLQLFSVVNYEVDTFNNSEIHIEFKVTEILYWIANPIFSLADRNFNVWWFEEEHELDRTNIGLELTRMNFRGRDESIRTTVQVGYNKFFEFYYKIPYIDKKLHHGIAFGAEYQTGRETYFQTKDNKLDFYSSEIYPLKKFKGRVNYRYRKAYTTIHECELSYNSSSITNELFTKNPDYLGGRKKLNFFELKYSFTYNNTDIRVYPINGVDLKSYISKKGLGIDKDVNQLIIYNETSFYKKLGRNLSSSTVFRGRLLFPQNQVYSLNRAFGFKNEYVRGYEYYVVDGTHYAMLRNNLRYKIIDQVVSQNLVRFIKYIPIRLYAKVFDDVGYVYNKYPGDSKFNNRLLNGFGVGIDIVISYYAKFRIEYSFNHLRENSLFLHGSKE